MEYSPEEETFFGYCVSPLGPNCDEWGYTTLETLEAVVVQGLEIEWDFCFTPTKMGIILDYWGRTNKTKQS